MKVISFSEFMQLKKGKQFFISEGNIYITVTATSDAYCNNSDWKIKTDKGVYNWHEAYVKK